MYETEHNVCVKEATRMNMKQQGLGGRNVFAVKNIKKYITAY